MSDESPHGKHSVNTEKLSESRSITTTTVTNIVHWYESPHDKHSYNAANTNYFSFNIVGRVTIPVMTFKITILYNPESTLIHYLNELVGDKRWHVLMQKAELLIFNGKIVHYLTHSHDIAQYTIN